MVMTFNLITVLMHPRNTIIIWYWIRNRIFLYNITIEVDRWHIYIIAYVIFWLNDKKIDELQYQGCVSVIKIRKMEKILSTNGTNVNFKIKRVKYFSYVDFLKLCHVIKYFSELNQKFGARRYYLSSLLKFKIYWMAK